MHAVRGSYHALVELSSLTDAQARTAGKDLKTAVSKHYKAAALLALDAPRERMLMVLSGQKGAGAYLTVAPRFAHLRLSDAEARAAALIRLGMPHACMEAVGGADKLGRHALRKKGAGRNAVHGAQTQCVAGLSRRAGRTATVEVVGLYGPYLGQLSSASKKGENRHMDLVEQNVEACTLDLVDNTIRDGATPSIVNGRIGEPAARARNCGEGQGSQVRRGQARRLDVHHVCPGHAVRAGRADGEVDAEVGAGRGAA